MSGNGGNDGGYGFPNNETEDTGDSDDEDLATGFEAADAQHAGLCRSCAAVSLRDETCKSA